MNFLDHLMELRKRLIHTLWGVLLGFLIAYHYSRQIYEFLMRPLCRTFEDPICPIIYMSVAEPFMVYVKVGIISGIFLAAPWIFFQLWKFVSPGLHTHEKKWVIPFVGIASMMFVGGSLLGYFYIFPLAFEFFLKEAARPIRPMLGMNNYFSFATTMLLAFGVLFEIPVLVVLLNLIGLVQAKTLWRTWRFGVAGIFILAAIITPADPYSMLLFGIPLSILYLGSLAICSLIEGARENTREKTI